MQYLALFLSFLIALFFTGCSHIKEITGEYQTEIETDLNYTVIYYIHADSDYLFHDSEGKPVRENSNVLETALEVAESARSGEVFIIYQRRERKILGLFPRRSSRFFHYRNGQQINLVKYRHPDKKEVFLATETELINEHRAHNRSDDHQNYFLYFGHEIPSENGTGYHRSLPDIEVNTVSLTNGIQSFLLTEEDRYSLVVLSTCNNGTPGMAKLLMPFTDAMLASPQNLHLSHLDSDKMTLLEEEPDISPLQLGHSMAEKSYQRLGETVQTTITLALYDFEDVEPYINTLNSLIAEKKVPDRSVQFQDNVDCAQINLFEPEAFRQGVATWYKPARFGRQSGQSAHSGWGCKPRLEN